MSLEIQRRIMDLEERVAKLEDALKPKRTGKKVVTNARRPDLVTKAGYPPPEEEAADAG